jgi:hypothetical protein
MEQNSLLVKVANYSQITSRDFLTALKICGFVLSDAVTKSALFFILATLLLFVGEFCCLFGHFARQRRIFTFISGVLCIISGVYL